MVGLREWLVRLRRCGCWLKRGTQRGNIAEGSGQGIDYRKGTSRSYAEHYQPSYPAGEAKQNSGARIIGSRRNNDNDGAYHRCGKSSNKYPG